MLDLGTEFKLGEYVKIDMTDGQKEILYFGRITGIHISDPGSLAEYDVETDGGRKFRVFGDTLVKVGVA